MTFSKVRAVTVVAVLFILAGFVVVAAIRKDSQKNGQTVSKCAPGEIPVNLDMPEPKDITINVINGTGKADLANQVSQEFANRAFTVGDPQTAPDGTPFADDIAVITYGPHAIGAAYEVSAYFLSEARMDFELDRQDPTLDNVVDVTIGGKYQQLATTTEVNQAIAQIGEPEPEEGTCKA